MRKKYYVKGMHCSSCEIYIEKELVNLKYVKNPKVSCKDQTLEIDLGKGVTEEKFLKDFNKILKNSDYTIQKEPIKKKVDKKELLISLVIAIIVLFLFFQLEKTNLFASLNLGDNVILTPFLIGVISSLSSCLAVVGSLLISITALSRDVKFLSIFHISRILSFFLLGMLLGLIGTFLSFTSNFYLISGLILAFVMVLLGLNILGLLPSFKLPKIVSSKTLTTTTSPILLGLITFFLPCGFTQSMQLMSVSSGEIIQGGLIMLFYSLGTFPMLALISFGLTKLLEKKYSSMILKISGFLIIGFAIYNIVSLLVSVGIIRYSIF